MQTLFDALQANNQRLIVTARQARLLARDAEGDDASCQALEALLRTQGAALDARQLDAWLALVQDPRADAGFDADARGNFNLVWENVCETETLPDGRVHQLIAIPLVASGGKELWKRSAPDGLPGQVEALYKRCGMVAADAQMQLLPAVLEPGVAAALSPGAVFCLTRLLAGGDVDAAFDMIDEDVDQFESAPVLHQGERVLSGGVLLAVVTGVAEGLFPLEEAYWTALQEMQDLEAGADAGAGAPLTQEQAALAAREVQGLRNAVDEALRAASAELATLLDVTCVDVLSGPGDFYRAVEDVLAHCRLLATMSTVGNAAITHAGGERARVAIGDELQARPDGRPGFLVSLLVDGRVVDDFSWATLRGETAEESLAALAAVLDHAGVAGAAPAGERA